MMGEKRLSLLAGYVAAAALSALFLSMAAGALETVYECGDKGYSG